jgi:hypothetical protein
MMEQNKELLPLYHEGENLKARHSFVVLKRFDICLDGTIYIIQDQETNQVYAIDDSGVK